ncbi:glycosyltransferase [Neobacillus cucumis]|uniref:CgeB family protein n=1 Tax=Neobacillus cucumis TaxID=1740721 RepID=UPI00204204A6|nr:glycosyltransferase [Neobacillus cucumis]MCM3729740.1 glycosyltransferase [Neobacillus cucumis]
MKILLISSGYSGIYPYFEKAIEDAFIFFDHIVTKIQSKYTIEAIELIKNFKPDVIITLVGFNIDEKLMDFLKKIKSPRCIWLTEDPFYIDMSIHLVSEYDYIFTIDIGAFEYYKKKFPQKHIYHLPLGTDPLLYYAEHKEEYLYDVCLVGYPYPERINLVNQLLAHTPYSLILVGPFWKKFIKNHKHTSRLTIINRWMEPEAVRSLFNRSKIILNPHRTYNFHKNKNTLEIENKSINNRTFDIAACGAFQLLSNKPDLQMHFDITQEMVVYSSSEECIELVKQFINDENSRNFYRRNAQKRVAGNHTFTHRVEFILKQLEANQFLDGSVEKFYE